jgi:tetratricopeptide (TPR) repeat protein
MTSRATGRRMDLALEQAHRSVALDERDCFCRCVVGRALSLFRGNDEAAASLEAATELNPSFAQAYFAQGFNMLWAGKAIEAESLLDRATSLSPRDSHLWSFHHVRAWAHFSLGELDAAAEFARRATHQPNVTNRAFATLAASRGAAGKGDSSEARGDANFARMQARLQPRGSPPRIFILPRRRLHRSVRAWTGRRPHSALVICRRNTWCSRRHWICLIQSHPVPR